MLARPRKWRRSEIEVLGEPGVIGGYAEPQNIFFRFLRLCLSRETYIAMEECMVEAAGVRIFKEQLIPITTYRCEECGFLESYAMESDES